VRARAGAVKRISLLEVFQARSRCQNEGTSFVEWVAEHRDGLEAGIRHYEALGDANSLRHAEALRETIRRPRRW